MIVLGIDPGGASTGLALVDTRRLDTSARPEPLAHLVVANPGDLDDYRAELRLRVETMLDVSLAGVDLVAIEGLVHPNPHLGLANVTGLLGTARVLGWLEAELDRHRYRVVIVRPGGHGSSPRVAYPDRLIGPREGPKLTGRLRHARSAYDVALAGANGSRHTA